MEENNNQQQLQIELKPEVAEGTYSNLAIITHSSSEVVTDFIQMMPGMQKAQVKSRVISVIPRVTIQSLRFLFRPSHTGPGKHRLPSYHIESPDQRYWHAPYFHLRSVWKCRK